MAAILFAQTPAQHTCQYVPHNTFQVPPIQQVAIPMQQHFLAGYFNAGRGGRQGSQGRGHGWGGWGNTPFVDYMQTAGAMQSVPGQLIPHGGGMAQIPPPPGVRNPDFSNVYKRYNNQNGPHVHHVPILQDAPPTGVHPRERTAIHCSRV
jgi:hypothetical protein